MPRTPKGHKRPADVISNAVTVMKIATGEVKETEESSIKNSAAVELGRMGGATRAKNLSARKRSAIASKAAQARWKNQKRAGKGRRREK